MVDCVFLQRLKLAIFFCWSRKSIDDGRGAAAIRMKLRERQADALQYSEVNAVLWLKEVIETAITINNTSPTTIAL